MGHSWKRKIATAFVGILVSEIAGVLGAWFTVDGVREWYPSLRKPSFTPPSWLFGPVWTSLYAMMGVAVSMIWRRRDGSGLAKRALGLFTAQLALNSLWSFAFFKRRSTTAGLFVIVPLWALILLTIFAFSPIALVAGLLLVPYLLWTSFAAVLNFRLWQLNRKTG